MAKSRLIAPEPPSDLNAIKLTSAVTPSTWFRIAPSQHGPLYWSRTGAYRFDSPDAKWGVCYAGESIEAVFLEVWGDVIRRHRRIDWKTLESATAWKLTINDPTCIALFGDDTHPREYQKRIRAEKLGPMTHWRRLFSYAEQIQLRISNTPDAPPAPSWV